MNKFSAIAFIVILGLSACSGKKEENSLPEGVGINKAYLDTTVNAGDDFFKFVNGGWVNKAQIPADQGSWGSFGELRDSTQSRLLKILNRAATSNKYGDNSDQRKAADFFSVGMDSLQAEQMGIKPIQPFLDKINAIKTKQDIQGYLIEQQQIGGGAFFTVAVATDLKKSDEVALYLNAGGLGLPERDYYTKTDAKSREIQHKYAGHMTKLLSLGNVEPAKAAANVKTIVAMETAMANATMTKEDRRNPDKRYNKRSIDQLSRLVPSIQWEKYLIDLRIAGIDSVILGDPGYMSAVENILSGRNIEDIKAYLRWRLMDRAAPLLSSEFVNEDFEFNTKYLRGVLQPRPRWKRVLDATNGAVGEALGKLYVEETFPPEAKQKAMEMVENIKLAFADRIKDLDWMSDSTKAKALKKLSTITVKIAYPDEWKSYAGLVVEKNPERSSYAQNVLNGQRFNFDQQIAKLGKPVDRKEWRMTPQTVNAYYNSTVNEIVFPAAILQPPFYDYRADEAVNYGGIGAVIGHEISHGFDDQGSKFDADGNLKNWWTEEDLKKFQEKGKAYAEQFSRYEPLPGVHVQGQFTLGENIGDLGGLSAAYAGLQRFLRENGRPGLIDGYTPEQRFFISWATIWRTKSRDETLRTQVNTDPHSPGMYRANGPASNMPEFYEAFGIKPGDPMYRDEKDRVKIW